MASLLLRCEPDKLLTTFGQRPVGGNWQRKAPPLRTFPPSPQATAEAARVDAECGPFHDVGGSGSWRYTVGLVGKPSAGKSTLFNAITDPLEEGSEARVASFPFTTIDPNVGQGGGDRKMRVSFAFFGLVH